MNIMHVASTLTSNIVMYSDFILISNWQCILCVYLNNDAIFNFYACIIHKLHLYVVKSLAISSNYPDSLLVSSSIS